MKFSTRDRYALRLMVELANRGPGEYLPLKAVGDSQGISAKYLEQIVAPLACIVITLFAIPAGIATGRQSVFRGIVGALCMFFAFYGLTIGFMVLAKKGWMPPIPAAMMSIASSSRASVCVAI